MILAGHQPVYLPGIILFNKISLCDAFMFVGHCQYSPRSWQTRNHIRNVMLSVPVKKDLGQSINETKIDGDHWRRKHLKSIEVTYSKTPYFKDYFPILEERIGRTDLFTHLGTLNVALMCDMMGWLDLKPLIYFSDQFEIGGHKTDMLIEMCKAVGATEYLSNEGARDYVDEVAMKRAGITHRWQKFTHPIYDQGHREFMTNLSAIDLLFNKGPEARKIIRECGHVG